MVHLKSDISSEECRGEVGGEGGEGVDWDQEALCGGGGGEDEEVRKKEMGGGTGGDRRRDDGVEGRRGGSKCSWDKLKEYKQGCS